MTDEIRVLHVDDDPDFADLTTACLEREDDRFVVESVTSASEGLDRLDDAVDCLVSDYDMPGQNGVEFLEAVRERRPDLPFILFTGKGSEELASEAISAGVTDYLQKGGGTSQYAVLANRIENAVEQYRSRRALEASQERFSRFVEQSPLGVVEWDDEFNFVRLNEAAEEILGYDEADLKGRSWEVVVPEADRDAVEDVVSDLLEVDGGYHSINENVRGDGKRVTCEWYNHVVTDEDGEAVAVYSQFQDVTERVDREKRLRQTTARLEALFDQSPDMVHVHDADGNLVDSNPHLCEKTGYGEAEVTDMKVWDLDRARDPDEAQTRWAKMGTGDRHRVDGVYRRRDGSTFPVEVHVRRLDIEREDRFLAISRDITDRREYEQELEKATDRMRLALQGSESWLWEWDLTAGSITQTAVSGILDDGEVTHISDDGATRCIDEEEFIADVHPDDRDEVVAGRDRAVEGDGRYRNEFRIRQDGAVRWIDSRGQVHYDDGEPERVVGIATDVTERKEREHEREWLQQALDQSDEAVFVSDPETARIEHVNDTACERLGYDRDDLLEMTILDIQTDIPDMDAWRDHVDSVRSDGHSFVGGSHVRSDGTQFPVEVNTGLIDMGGRERLLGIARDITHRRERERELERQNERLEEFAGFVSHDLRNPLQVATGRLELAREECDSEYLDDAAGAIDRMETLIDDILTLARQGEAANDVEPVALATVVERCWQAVETGEADLVVETDLTVEADPGRLQQLLENLVRNAVEHSSTSPGSQVRQDAVEHGSTSPDSHARRDAGRASSSEPSVADAPEDAVEGGGPAVTVTVGDVPGGFYVADDGPGIPEDEREQVFESGYSTADGGTGFGLAIVREIAEAHGWTVRPTDSEDGGARFEVTSVETAEADGPGE